MPKNIVTRSATGLDCASRRLRSGHFTKSIDKSCCCCCPENIDDQLTLFTEQMNMITRNFFEPFYESPLCVDLKKSYNQINEFFNEQKTIYANKPEVITQIDFIVNAMTIVREDASQYFLKSLQFESLSREIETSIQGLLLHIYMLNSRIAILSGYSGEDAIGGSTNIEVKQIQDPRYAVAKYQPKLSMLSFLFPDEPTGKYYSKLKTLLSMSGMYESEEHITHDMTNFLDRYIVKYDVNKTLEQWMYEQDNINSDEIIDYTDIIENDEKHIELMRQWREINGNTILDGQLTIDVRNIDKYLSQHYHSNLSYLKTHYHKPEPICPPSNPKIHPWQSPLGRMIPLSGSFSLNPVNNLAFNAGDVSTCNDELQKTLDKMYLVSQTINTRQKSSYKPPVFSRCSVTKKHRKVMKNNSTRKNICL